jgi:hypothetical protein
MIDKNPYAAPDSAEPLAKKAFPPFEVRGQYLLIESGAHLPQRCIKTNEEVPVGQRVDHVFQWAPSFRLALRYRQCRLTFYLSERKQREIKRVKTAGWFLLICGGLVPLVAAVLGGGVTGRSGALLALPGGIALLAATQTMSQLRIVRFRDGRYWVHGFSKEFLQSLR